MEDLEYVQRPTAGYLAFSDLRQGDEAAILFSLEDAGGDHAYPGCLVGSISSKRGLKRNPTFKFHVSEMSKRMVCFFYLVFVCVIGPRSFQVDEAGWAWRQEELKRLQDEATKESRLPRPGDVLAGSSEMAWNSVIDGDVDLELKYFHVIKVTSAACLFFFQDLLLSGDPRAAWSVFTVVRHCWKHAAAGDEQSEKCSLFF